MILAVVVPHAAELRNADTPFLLAEVIDELNRYRSGRIVLMNASLAQSPVNGQFKIDRPDDALAQIELGFGVRRRTLPGGLILLG